MQPSLFGQTVEEAKVDIERVLTESRQTDCPCCGQRVKRYERSIYAQPAKFLIWLAKAYQRDHRWYDWREEPVRGDGQKGGGDYSKLRFWGLIEHKPNTDKHNLPQNYSGMWRPTQKGISFAYNKLAIPKYALIYNNKLLGFKGEMVTITDCLPEYFSFWEL